MREQFHDHYLVLGLDLGCSADDVRSAFRKRLLEVHPDKTEHPIDPDAMRTLLDAFEVLSDPGSRESYDRMWQLIAGKNPALSSIPHVTESERPAARARSILFLLLVVLLLSFGGMRFVQRWGPLRGSDIFVGCWRCQKR
jgi:curved DNA-binding protein CbpA